jgi:signal transduction histidine kinase
VPDPTRRRADEIAGLIHDALNQYQVSQTRLQLAAEQLAKAHRAGADSARFLQEAMTLATRLMAAPSERVELNAVMQEVADHLTGVLPRIEIQAQPGPELWTTVDRTLLLRAIDNLVRNAGDAMPAGGTVTMRTVLEAEGQLVCLQVRDTGVGMDAATLAQLWQPGFTTKGTGDPGDRPRGFGLTNVKKFVEEHGGRVRVESSPGEGTLMELCFMRVLEAA